MAAFKTGPVEIYFDKILGHGAYGEVCKAKCGALPCAAKALHDVLFSCQDPGESIILKKFDEECQFLSSIKHPNIIQYLGTAVDEKSGRHVLLMELMDESLTKLLERSKRKNSPLSQYQQISICCDVTLALTYLHSNDIIHRDLSSNNVLLLAGRRAKVADFGVSTIFDKNINHLTICPGSKVYMPPEAQVEPPCYSKKLDCFSLGVLIIQMATLNFPDPAPLLRAVSNPEYHSGLIQVFVPELERRENDIRLVGEDHPLLKMALICLDDYGSRPPAQQLCEELLEMRAQTNDDLSGGEAKDIDGKENEKGDRSGGESDRGTRDKDEGNEGGRKGSSGCNVGREDDQAALIEALLEALELKTEQLASLETEISIVNKESVGTGGHSEDGVPAGRVSEGSSEDVEVESKNVAAGSSAAEGESSDGTTTLAREVHTTGWVYEASPESFSAYDSSCVFDADRAYFLKKLKLYCYQCGKHGGWSQLVDASYQYCGLAIISGRLTTISGWSGMTLSRALLTLHGGDTWTADLPSIPTGREAPACASTSSHLVVLGGVVKFRAVTYRVEVLDLGNCHWSTATSIPELRTPQAVCCGETVYLSSYASDSLYCCQVPDLLQSVEGTEADRKVSSSLWIKLQSLPAHSKASIAAIGGHMIAVGGGDEGGKDMNAIYCYNREINWWYKIGNMPTARKLVLVGIFPDARIMCVGGQSDATSDLRVVEVGHIKEMTEVCDGTSAAVPSGARSCSVM